MGIGYQRRDLEIVDYQLYPLVSPKDERVFIVRGPQIGTLEPDRYFASVGAAFTFGCYCEKPYGTLLQEKLGLPTLNLGFAGAGPYFFLKNWDYLANFINQAKFVTILVMSGRSESNSLFDSGGLEMYRRRSDGQAIAAENAYKELLQQYEVSKAQDIVAETRHNWIQNYRDLLTRIEKPKILLWQSKRPPAYQEAYTDVQSLFGDFPQFVNAEMVEAIKPYSDAYVECVSDRGMPQRLINRFTQKPATVTGRADLGGKMRTHNSYYASPEMHEDAAAQLLSVCQTLLT